MMLMRCSRQDAVVAADQAVEVLASTPGQHAADALMVAVTKIRDRAHARLESDERNAKRALTSTTTTVQVLGWGAGNQMPPHPRRH